MATMKNVKCLITAGATREYFDPVRFISNPSTGKMGTAIAKAALQAGWTPTLISGEGAVPPPDGVRAVRVVSAEDMLRACRAEFDKCDVLIMTAAVSDVRPKKRAADKIKKDEIDLRPELERTPDILLELSKVKTRQYTVGFAAETRDVRRYAEGKIVRKKLDAIVANDVSAPNAGFAVDTNKITMIFADGGIFESGFDSKENLAREIVKKIGERLPALQGQ